MPAPCIMPRIAEQRIGPLDPSLDALSGDRREARNLVEFQLALGGTAQDGLGEGMLAAGFERGGEAQHIVIGEPVRRLDAGQRRLALGQSAGLVDDQRIDRGQPLERRGIAHQHAGLRAAPGRHHDRDRRGKSERAGAGDDQHAHRRDQRVGELRRRSPTHTRR